MYIVHVFQPPASSLQPPASSLQALGSRLQAPGSVPRPGGSGRRRAPRRARARPVGPRTDGRGGVSPPPSIPSAPPARPPPSPPPLPISIPKVAGGGRGTSGISLAADPPPSISPVRSLRSRAGTRRGSGDLRGQAYFGSPPSISRSRRRPITDLRPA